MSFIEDFIRERVLPGYANTHTESSGTGLQTTVLREDARRIVRDAVGGDDDTVIVFCGSGATSAIDKMVGILGLRFPRSAGAGSLPPDERPVIFIGPYEHHSNELPWRESIADVVTIPEDPDGHVDLDALRAGLVAYADRPLRIGAFSAASNVTGILTDTQAIARTLHEHGALSFWDFAAAAPYVEIDMNPAGDPLGYLDAVFLSPHKFVGGPGTPGCWPPGGSCSVTRCPSSSAVERCRMSTRSSIATSPTRRTARRAARLPSSSRSGPAWYFSSREPSVPT